MSNGWLEPLARSQGLLQTTVARPLRQCDQMRRTATVARAEAQQRPARPWQSAQRLRPTVLEAFMSISHPDSGQVAPRTQKVQMPMRPGRDAVMMTTARSHATGSEGAADIEEDLFDPVQRQRSQTADLYGALLPRHEEDGIGAGAAVSGCGIAHADTARFWRLTMRGRQRSVGQPHRMTRRSVAGFGDLNHDLVAAQERQREG